MSMTRGNALQYLKKVYLTTKNDSYREALSIALSALRGPTREMVERIRGRTLSDVSGWNGSWIVKCSRCGATIGLGSEGDYDITHKYRFCPMCMSPFTDEAVDMVMERWKEAVDGEAD